MLKLVLFLEGKLSFYVLGESDGSSKMKDFFEDLEKKRREDFDNVMKLIKRYSAHGQFPKNPEIFKPVEGTNCLFEIKKHQVRIYGFFYHGLESFVMVRGDLKKQDGANQNVIKTVVNLNKLFCEEQNGK